MRTYMSDMVSLMALGVERVVTVSANSLPTGRREPKGFRKEGRKGNDAGGGGPP